ncbi:hypothetical protein AVEN_176514-1 [Araneus ventricosus]|uniref:Uncharacterized protein n=1 Tax=Araneus ventricosus TaxID=182803 RepID=A0A4Y1ZT20_ARAVE|nr:hypothetical protein AVEN_93628-1 [Araneus ventricosus]GBL66752.1 hypothetical protein AVEN_176514-1 [Araneus ventricosus]
MRRQRQKIYYLKEIILNSDDYKGDPDFVKGILENALTDRELQEEKEFELDKLNKEKEFERDKLNKEKELELEKIKLRQQQKFELENLKMNTELELARMQTLKTRCDLSANVRN